jgi:hypothetical protein
MRNFLATQIIFWVAVLTVCASSGWVQLGQLVQRPPDLLHPQRDDALLDFLQHCVRLFACVHQPSLS